MEEKNKERPVPYIVYEYTMARFERTIHRLIIALIVAVVALFASNMAWLYVWNQYDYSSVTVDSKDGGNANYLEAGISGVINNAESGSQEENQEE
jgi:multidrug resistance efflux pump